MTPTHTIESNYFYVTLEEFRLSDDVESILRRLYNKVLSDKVVAHFYKYKFPTVISLLEYCDKNTQNYCFINSPKLHVQNTNTVKGSQKMRDPM